jgi:dTDP-6-deoxy-L-talose 4-dehydrogenase (NAD+)
MYGDGQHERSLWTQFHAARRQGTSFDMSGGQQLRDFLPVETVAKHIVRIVLDRAGSAVVNICSGRPVTVENLVREWARSAGWNGQLNLGRYPYPDWEPMNFWGDVARMTAMIGSTPDWGKL